MAWVSETTPMDSVMPMRTLSPSFIRSSNVEGLTQEGSVKKSTSSALNRLHVVTMSAMGKAGFPSRVVASGVSVRQKAMTREERMSSA